MIVFHMTHTQTSTQVSCNQTQKHILHFTDKEIYISNAFIQVQYIEKTQNLR